MAGSKIGVKAFTEWLGDCSIQISIDETLKVSRCPRIGGLANLFSVMGLPSIRDAAVHGLASVR